MALNFAQLLNKVASHAFQIVVDIWWQLTLQKKTETIGTIFAMHGITQMTGQQLCCNNFVVCEKTYNKYRFGAPPFCYMFAPNQQVAL